jgi:hypothetical protein
MQNCKDLTPTPLQKERELEGVCGDEHNIIKAQQRNNSTRVRRNDDEQRINSW